MVLTTNLRPPLELINGRKTKKIEENINVSDENDMRILRYQMQSAARHMLPNNRIRICLRNVREKYGTVDVFKHRQTQKVFYGGLMICGSVWICPVCAAKISERRRAELRHAYDTHKADGGYCSMLTLTFSHGRHDRLKDLLEALGKATQIFRRGKRSDKLRSEIGEIGSIRALEITYGENGWHPHIHLVMMHTREIEPWERMDYQEQYYDLWESACEKVGLTTSYEHGLKLDDAAEADEYIGKWGDIVKTKWGIDREMTKANSKKGRAGSLTPFDFLRRVVEDGDLEYMPQYKEYADAMKGKKQLNWSRGLKQRFQLKDLSDEEIAEAKEEPADLLGALTWADWRFILKQNKRAELQILIEQYGYEQALIKIGLKKEKDVPENTSCELN